MTKKTTAAPKTRKARVSKTPRASLIDKLLKINYTLGTFLTPRFSSVGTTFVDSIRMAQENVVAAGQAANKLDDDWAPAVRRVRQMTPERLEKLRAQAEKLQARIAEAEASRP